MKLDVEGAELAVLRGGYRLLGRDRPMILVEANDQQSLNTIEAYLGQFGYSWSQPEGFEPWNYLFYAASEGPTVDLRLADGPESSDKPYELP